MPFADGVRKIFERGFEARLHSQKGNPMAVNGMRGTGDYPGNQRPTNFKGGVKRMKMKPGTMTGGRVTREEIEKHMAETHRNIPANVKKTGKTGKAKEKMIRAISMSKARRGK